MKNITSIALFTLSLLTISATIFAAATTDNERLHIKAAIPNATLADRVADELDFLDSLTATATELNYVAGVPGSLDYFAATLTTNFQGIAASDCKDSGAITVTGAAAGDPCSLGVNATAGALDITFTCYVSAADAVKIHVCNETASDITGMASGAYKVRVWDS